MPAAGPRTVVIELNAVLVALITDEPQVLTLEGCTLLPSGSFETDHPTLQTGLRAWVERQTHHPLGYVEQLYTFADRNRAETESGRRIVSISFLGLTRERMADGAREPGWQSWYRYFPWEDRRAMRRRGANGVSGSKERSMRRRGTKNSCCSATSCSTRRVWSRKPDDRAIPSPIRFPARRCAMTIVASSRPESRGCAPRSNTARWYSS